MRHDAVFSFGDARDGVIGIPMLTGDGRVVEASYFFGETRPKNILVISSQAGCPLRCSFCELGGERFHRNLSSVEMLDQTRLMLAEAGRYGFSPATTPHKVTVANSGEPLFNPALVEGLSLMGDWPESFKVSTVFPDGAAAWRNMERLAAFAADCVRPVQLQVSLISTSEERRQQVSGGHVATFRQIREAGERWRAVHPNGRLINLSLIVTDDMPCDPADVAAFFPPSLFRFRFREYVPTHHGVSHDLVPVRVQRLAAVKQAFAGYGYEVGDWASPSATERRFKLASNAFVRMYREMTQK